jgi:serine/threonine protein kinase
MTDPTQIYLSESVQSSQDDTEGFQGIGNTSSDPLDTNKRCSKKRKKDNSKENSNLNISTVGIIPSETCSPLVSPDSRKRRLSDDLEKTDRQRASGHFSITRTDAVLAEESTFNSHDETDMDERLRINYAECYQECKCDVDEPDVNHFNVEEYIRNQAILQYEENTTNLLNRQTEFAAAIADVDESEEEFHASLAHTMIPKFPLTEVSEEDMNALPPPNEEQGNHYQLDSNHFMANISQKFKPFKVVQSAVDCLEENLIYETISPKFSVPSHFAQEERDVPIFKSKLEWVRAHSRDHNNSLLWERLLLEMDDDRASNVVNDHRHPSFDCMSNLNTDDICSSTTTSSSSSSSDSTRYYDGDFGWRMKVPILTPVKYQNGDIVCRHSNIPLFNIYTLRRKISLLEDGETLSMHTPLYAPNELAGHPPQRLQWKQCKGESDYLFGFCFSKVNFEIELEKGVMNYEDFYIHPTTKERFPIISPRDVLIANFYNPATHLSKQYIFDCFQSFPDSHLQGKLLQGTIYGEVYHGREYVIRKDIHRNMNYLLSSLDIVIKVVRCQARGNSTATLKTDFRQQRNENVLREIEAMDYLQRMHHSHHAHSSSHSASSFMQCRNILKDFNNLYVFTDYFEYGCLYDYLQVSRRFNRLHENECKMIIKEIAQALLFMHKFGMAHQDLSTENILLQLKPHYKNRTTSSGSSSELEDSFEIDKISFDKFAFLLIDFGQVVGHQFDAYNSGFKDLPGRAFCVGKTIYHCPELFLNNRNHDYFRRNPSFFAVSHDYNGLRVDSWQLGILMYVLLTGQPPWNYHSPEEYRLKIEWLESIREDRLRDHEVYWSYEKNRGETRYLASCMSKEAFDLLSCLLKFNPMDRFTMENVLEHPWINN